MADASGELTDVVVVLTTVGSEDAAATLVSALLEQRLVGCGTVLPAARSLYRWEGRVADEREAVVLLKTVRVRLPALEAAFAVLHPYRVPELLVLPVTAGLAPYLRWVAEETTQPPA